MHICLQARHVRRHLTDCVCIHHAAVALRRAMNHKKGRPPTCLHARLMQLIVEEHARTNTKPEDSLARVTLPALQAAAQSQTSST